MADTNVSENLFQAIDVIVGARLSKLEFDKTVICKITDDSNAARGEYKVSDGSTEFTAYTADISLMKDVAVYVTIPNGDFTKQKMITGKYIKKETEYFTYISPLDTYVDITGNLVDSSISQGLVANGDIKEKFICNAVIENGKAFDRIGIKADFKSWLTGFNVVSGTFGIRLNVTHKDMQTTSTQETQLTEIFSLDSNEMYGDPYNFEVPYSQSKVFDISNLEIITNIAVSFFQLGDFRNKDGELVKSKDELGKELVNNIFIQNCYISLGYDFNDFQTDTALLYTMDSQTFTDDKTKSYYDKRKKKLELRWIHIDGDKIYSIDTIPEIPEGTIIHWYHYNLKEGLADQLAKAFWEEIPNTQNKFSYIADPKVGAAKERYKVIIEYPSRDFVRNERDNDDAIKDFLAELQKNVDNYNNNKDNIDKIKIDTDEEKRCAVVWDNEETKEPFIIPEDIFTSLLNYNNEVEKYNGMVQLYESPELILENEEPQPNEATLHLIRDLTIACDEEYYKGVYRLYTLTNEIQNPVEANKMRLLEAKYNTFFTDEAELDTAESITWKIPLTNTMIYPPEEGKEYTLRDKDGKLTGITYKEKDGYALITRTSDFDTSNIAAGDTYETKIGQYFRIKNYYTQSATNNKIECIIVKNNLTYIAETELIFGPMGTNGTDYTLTLEMIDKQTALTLGDTTPVKIKATLFDFENKEIEDFSKMSTSYKWYSRDKDNDPQIVFCDENGNEYSNQSGDAAVNFTTSGTTNEVYIKLKSESSIPKYFILQATTKCEILNSEGESPLGEVDLTAFLPIAIRRDLNYREIDGTTKIVYDSNGGNPSYFKEPYKLYKGKSYQAEPNVKWSILLNDIGAEKYYPTIEEDTGKIVPTAMFFKGNDTRVSTIAQDNNGNILWIQPLIIIQNRYSSAMLNSWDGSLTIDENNGTILSTMVGAGYKDSLNRYNGVLMGDVQVGSGDDSTKTGLYGFHEGSQSFGFKIDGTAFIGKSGKGRIEFDGNNGTITSGNYTKDSEGMMIDLDGEDGQSSLLYAYGGGGSFELNTSSNSSNLLSIKDGSKRDLFIIKTTTDSDGDPNGSVASGFYLQSSNFNSSNKTGTRFDLKNGKITSYGSKGAVFLDSSSSNIFRIQYRSGSNFKTILNAGDSYYLQSIDYDSTNKAGTKIDLNNGRITSYNFNITAYNTQQNSSYIQIKSDSTECPFDVNNNFRIAWNGSFSAGGSNFKVASNGNLTTSGDISISGSFSASGNISLQGAITGKGWKVTSGGEASFDNVTVDNITANNKGTIAGWTISSNGFTDSNGNYIRTTGLKLGDIVINSNTLSIGQGDLKYQSWGSNSSIHTDSNLRVNGTFYNNGNEQTALFNRIDMEQITGLKKVSYGSTSYDTLTGTVKFSDGSLLSFTKGLLVGASIKTNN